MSLLSLPFLGGFRTLATPAFLAFPERSSCLFLLGLAVGCRVPQYIINCVDVRHLGVPWCGRAERGAVEGQLSGGVQARNKTTRVWSLSLANGTGSTTERISFI